MKSGRIGRLVRILTTLQSGENYSAGDLEKLLSVSRRTIFRDLKELQNIGVPYQYDNKTGGYSIDSKFFLPPMDFNLTEALSLLLLVRQMRNHFPMPFKNSALLAGLKIENYLPRDIKEYCQATLQKTTISPGRHSGADRLDNVFSSLQKAIRQKRKVELLYDSVYEKKKISVVLRPYHVIHRNRAWYVFGKSELHNEIRMFNLGRIETIELMKTHFSDGDKFDVDEYLGRAWSLIPEGRLYDIRLRFLPRVARNVSEVKWHSTQEVSFNDDGSVTMDFRVDGLGEIAWWILGYGDQVEIIRPAALRKAVIKTAKEMIKLNEKL